MPGTARHRNVLFRFSSFPVFLCFFSLATALGADNDWPTVQHDMRRTGYTPTAPQPPYRYRWVWANGAPMDETKLRAIVGEETSRDSKKLPLSLLPDFLSVTFNSFAAPVVKDGLAFVGSFEGEMFAIDVATGETKWRSKASGTILHTATVAGDSVYVGTLRGVDAFARADGKLLWTFEDPHRGGFLACPAVGELSAGKPALVAQPPPAVVLIGSTSGWFFGLDAATGKPRWEFDTGAEIVQTPAAHDGAVYFGSENMHAYALEAATGKLRWKTRVRGHSFDLYWPVISDKDKVVMFRVHPENSSGQGGGGAAKGSYEESQQKHRESVQKNPYRRSFFVLNLSDGQERVFVQASQFGNRGDLAPPPLVMGDGRILVHHNVDNATFLDFNPYHRGSVFRNVDIGQLDLSTGLFKRLAPPGSRIHPARVAEIWDEGYHWTMGGNWLFAMDYYDSMGCQPINRLNMPQGDPNGWQRELYLKGLPLDEQGKELHGWYDFNSTVLRTSRPAVSRYASSRPSFRGGTIGGAGITLLPDAFLVNPFAGTSIVCFESRGKGGKE